MGTLFTRRFFLIFIAVFLALQCANQFRRMQHFRKYTASSGEDETETNTEINPNIETSRLAKLRAEYLNLTLYPIFQPTAEVEFPTVENGISRIPHIIHQIYSTEHVADFFTLPMQTFVRLNPTWEYRFWSYESGRDLIAEYHPYLVEVYDKFGNDVRKSDMLRYVVLYEFGGVYSDVDVRNLRPLDLATKKYACIIPTETFDHSTILNDKPLWLNTAVLLCRPKHPFFQLLLYNLQIIDFSGHAVFTTGPWYITQMYLKYNNLSMVDISRPKTDNDTNSPYFYKGPRHTEHEDGLYIPNSQYFMDTVDPLIIDADGNLKHCVDRRKLTYLAKRGCAEFEHRRKVRERRKYTFTVHYWFHLWAYTDEYKTKFTYVHVKDIIPTCILYKRLKKI